LHNFSAIAGANYPISATCEYKEDGMHYLAVLNGVVNVVEKPLLGKLGEPIVFALVVIIILVFVLFQLKRLLR